ncbi:2,3-diaminopropionate biosynthesis protein SbnB [Nocardia sp. NPDC051570]|uniref:2,3-diaminopropionate biosynthesis protein SbnB n=1 Tax=Nocardia sp. NPDC051570 TaxID=3364324 RepID=UPI0037B48C6B
MTSKEAFPLLEFHVIDGTLVREIIATARTQIIEKVRDTYLAHHDGATVNPDSYFLRFPEQPSSRIIALPAYLGAQPNIAGIKWISSYPQNIARNLPRASAVVILNDHSTGYPFACLEGAQISAARTAASAALAAEVIHGGRTATKIAVIGAGVIARNIVDFLAAQQWIFDELAIFDLVDDYAAQLATYSSSAYAYRSNVAKSLDLAILDSELVVLATTASKPYLTEPGTFRPGQVVLNISLRDIGPDVIYDAHNILDDVEHCLKADTSPHLAEQKYENRRFIDGTLSQIMRDEIRVSPVRPVIFSPFGLGVLDLSVAHHVYETAVAQGKAIEIDGFFGEKERW